MIKGNERVKKKIERKVKYIKRMKRSKRKKEKKKRKYPLSREH